MRFALENLTTEQRVEKSAAICSMIGSQPAWLTAKTVCLFSATAQEPDLEPLWAERGARRVCFPRVNGVDLDLLHVTDVDELRMSRWQLREPMHDEGKLVPYEAVDLVVVPGLAFTVTGQRLGRGRGYYDRLLSRTDLRAETIGVCFQAQLLPTLPLDPHDQRVGRVISA